MSDGDEDHNRAFDIVRAIDRLREQIEVSTKAIVMTMIYIDPNNTCTPAGCLPDVEKIIAAASK